MACSNELLPMLKEVGLGIDTDYVSDVEQSKEKLARLNDDMTTLTKEIKVIDKKLQTSKAFQDKLQDKYKTFESTFDTKYQKLPIKQTSCWMVSEILKVPIKD